MNSNELVVVRGKLIKSGAVPSFRFSTQEETEVWSDDCALHRDGFSVERHFGIGQTIARAGTPAERRACFYDDGTPAVTDTELGNELEGPRA